MPAALVSAHFTGVDQENVLSLTEREVICVFLFQDKSHSL